MVYAVGSLYYIYILATALLAVYLHACKYTANNAVARIYM